MKNLQVKTTFVLKFIMAKKNSSNILFSFLPLGVAITLICGLVFVAVQQEIRMTANDQIVQIAEDLAGRIAPQDTIPTNFPTGKIDIARSLSPYIIVYGADKKLLGSTGQLNGTDPIIPSGVLDAARVSENRVAWQPEKGVRSAIVAVHFKGKSEGFVVAGRSLREVEIREDKLQSQIGIGWLVTLTVAFILKLMTKKLQK